MSEALPRIPARLRGSHLDPRAYRDALDRAMRQPESLRRWYLSVVNEMAQKMAVQTVSIEGCWWTEIDSPEDLASARGHYPQRTQPRDSTR